MPVPLIPAICPDWLQFFPHMQQPLPRFPPLGRTLEELQFRCLQTPDQHKEQLFSIQCPFLSKVQVLGLYLLLVNQVQLHQVLEHCPVLNFFGVAQLLTLTIQTFLPGLRLQQGFHLILVFRSRVSHRPYTSHRSPFIGSHSHRHVGSAPSGLPLDRYFSYFPESPEASLMSPVAFGNLNRGDGNFMMKMGARAAGVGLSGNTTDISSPNFRMMSLPRHGSLFHGNSAYSGLGATSIERLAERGRNRQPDNGGNQMDSKKLYQLDLGKILSGEDIRTTLMIKNIPNKYTLKMLLAAIDESHQGTYDFLYLPIDFKNKCNVGYAFINMVSPSHVIPFYKAFNRKRWEKFNSKKVASLAYARIQGKAALVMHFQNSSLMNEDKRCRPILFHSKGQDTNDQEHFLSSN